MDHYEEFGLSPAATSEELRQAHKNLARLLHPDQIQDAALRALAESQMKRVNSIFATLNDPDRRREYDASLARGQSRETRPPMIEREPSGWRDAVRRNAVWGVAAFAGIGGLWWFFDEVQPAAGHPASRTAAIDAPKAAKPAEAQPSRGSRAGGAITLVEQTRDLRRMIERLQGERDAAVEQLARSRGRAADPPAPVAPEPVPPVKHVPQPPPERLKVEEGPPSPAAAVSGLAGTWIYIPTAAAVASDLYPPSFIELTVAEHQGRLQGRYRGRYRVADKPISPEVSFQFEGRAGESRFAWTGNGGASGAVELEPKPGGLAVSWWTSRLGRVSSLTSGAATLVRRREP